MNDDQLFEAFKLQQLTRRNLLKSASYGIGSLALQSLLAEAATAQQEPKRTDLLAPKPPHFKPKAKRVVVLFMAGAPSQLELFDYKPQLKKFDGQLCPDEYLKKERFAFIKGHPKMLGPQYDFTQVGDGNMYLSNLLPHTKEIAKDILLVNSLHTDQFNHAPAQIFMNSGTQIPGRPSMGSWMTYGLGSESRDLPGFVVLVSGDGDPDGGKTLWSNGFIPSSYQGVEFRSKGDAVLYVSNPDGVTSEIRRDQLDGINALNSLHKKISGDPEIDTRIASYELAYRMQTSVPELMDISKEPKDIHEMYGTSPGESSFANNCLLARRLLERGVRFVQLYHRGWDNHGTGPGDSLSEKLPAMCKDVDKAGAALVKDLKERGMLEDTIVVWCGEFGRTPMKEARDGSTIPGRDHHPHAFSCWIAGGGFKSGTSYGKTDEFGYNIVENPLSIHDLHATILNQLGLDHTQLTYKFQGRNFRLTDVFGEVQKGMLR